MSSRKRFGLSDVAEPSAGILKDKLKRLHPGINTSYVYCGKKHSSSPLHVEDAWLYSKNIARAGWKLWLIINPDDRSKLETKLAQVLKIPQMPHSDFARDNQIFIAPEQYQKWNIRYTLELQGPGDMIITYPEAYHQVLNVTDTLAEAINFAPDGWKLSNNYRFKDRLLNPTALSAEDFTAEEGHKALFRRGTKRGPVEKLAADDIQTPVEKRFKNSTTHLLTPLSMTGPRQRLTGRRTQSSSPQSIGRVKRGPTLIIDGDDNNIYTNSECDDNSSSGNGSSLDVDEGIAKSRFTNDNQFPKTSKMYTDLPGNNVETDLTTGNMSEDGLCLEEDRNTTDISQVESSGNHSADTLRKVCSSGNDGTDIRLLDEESTPSVNSRDGSPVVQASHSCDTATSDNFAIRQELIRPPNNGLVEKQPELSHPRLDLLRQRPRDEGNSNYLLRINAFG